MSGTGGAVTCSTDVTVDRQSKRGCIKGNMKINKLRGILRLSKRKDSRQSDIFQTK
jgi:hypothetical protein